MYKKFFKNVCFDSTFSTNKEKRFHLDKLIRLTNLPRGGLKKDIQLRLIAYLSQDPSTEFLNAINNCKKMYDSDISRDTAFSIVNRIANVQPNNPVSSSTSNLLGHTSSCALEARNHMFTRPPSTFDSQKRNVAICSTERLSNGLLDYCNQSNGTSQVTNQVSPHYYSSPEPSKYLKTCPLSNSSILLSASSVDSMTTSNSTMKHPSFYNNNVVAISTNNNNSSSSSSSGTCMSYSNVQPYYAVDNSNKNVAVNSLSTTPQSYCNSNYKLGPLITLASAQGTFRLPVELPGFNFEQSPFFQCLYVLYPPHVLHATNMRFAVGRQPYDSSLALRFTADQAETITYHCNRLADDRLNFGVQVIMRFARLDPKACQRLGEMYKLTNTPCLADAPPLFEDSLPTHLTIQVNGRAIQLPPLLPSNRAGMDGRRIARPINITQALHVSPTVPNYIKLSWTHDYSDYTYNAVGVYLMFRLSPQKLCSLLLSASIVKPECMKMEIIKRLSTTKNTCKSISNMDTKSPVSISKSSSNNADDDGDDDDVLMPNILPVLLLCPLSKCRIEVPVRGRSCRHIQCYDATTYLIINERKPTWKCPVCGNRASFKELMVDGLQMEVLKSKHTLHSTEVIFDEDGSWSVVTENGSFSPSRPPSRSSSTMSQTAINSVDSSTSLPPATPHSPLSSTIISGRSSKLSTEHSIKCNLPSDRETELEVVIDLTVSGDEDDSKIQNSNGDGTLIASRELNLFSTAVQSCSNSQVVKSAINSSNSAFTIPTSVINKLSSEYHTMNTIRSHVSPLTMVKSRVDTAHSQCLHKQQTTNSTGQLSDYLFSPPNFSPSYLSTSKTPPARQIPSSSTLGFNVQSTIDAVEAAKNTVISNNLLNIVTDALKRSPYWSAVPSQCDSKRPRIDPKLFECRPIVHSRPAMMDSQLSGPRILQTSSLAPVDLSRHQLMTAGRYNCYQPSRHVQHSYDFFGGPAKVNNSGDNIENGRYPKVGDYQQQQQQQHHYLNDYHRYSIPKPHPFGVHVTNPHHYHPSETHHHRPSHNSFSIYDPAYNYYPNHSRQQTNHQSFASGSKDKF